MKRFVEGEARTGVTLLSECLEASSKRKYAVGKAVEKTSAMARVARSLAALTIGNQHLLIQPYPHASLLILAIY